MLLSISSTKPQYFAGLRSRGDFRSQFLDDPRSAFDQGTVPWRQLAPGKKKIVLEPDAYVPSEDDWATM